VLELCASEYHIDPRVILETWSEEFLEIMLKAFVDRKQKQSDAMKSGGGTGKGGKNKREAIPRMTREEAARYRAEHGNG